MRSLDEFVVGVGERVLSSVIVEDDRVDGVTVEDDEAIRHLKWQG